MFLQETRNSFQNFKFIFPQIHTNSMIKKTFIIGFVMYVKAHSHGSLWVITFDGLLKVKSSKMNYISNCFASSSARNI